MSDIKIGDVRKNVRTTWWNGQVYSDPVTLDELLSVVADAVQPGRLEIVDPCKEHGEMDEHWLFADGRLSPQPIKGQPSSCLGGSRRIIPTGTTE